MSFYVLGFQDIDKTKSMVVGGKGANLGELSRIEGIPIPDGFCISTEAFKRIIEETSSINQLLDQLSLLKVEERNKICELTSEIRRVIEGIAIPQDIQGKASQWDALIDTFPISCQSKRPIDTPSCIYGSYKCFDLDQ